jgi:prefoldin subunit 5
MALNQSKKEFAESTSRLESIQSELQGRNREMKKKLEVSDQRMLDLSAAVSELGEWMMCQCR